MSETNSVFWVGDLVKILPTAESYDGSVIDSDLKGDNMYWYVTDVDYARSVLELGAYRAFGLKYMWSPAIYVSMSDTVMLQATCRHLESDIVIDPAKEPTCTEPGKTQTKYCKKCGTVILPSEVIPATGHDYEYCADTSSQICTLCKHELKLEDKIIDVTGKDIRRMIQIIEAMLAYRPDTTVPVVPDHPSDEPQFSYDIRFSNEWFTDKDLPYLLYTPSVVLESTPLIVWLHSSNEVSYSEENFKNSGLPQILENWKLQGFSSYILCPVASSTSWSDHSDSVFSIIDHVVNKYNIDTRKICLAGHVSGGTGTEYLAYQRPRYFSCQVIMSGYNSGVNIRANANLPTRIYVENIYYSSHFNTLKNVFGESSCFVLDCIQQEVPQKAFEDDTNKDNISDLILWMLSQTNSSLVEETPTFPLNVMVTSNGVNIRSGAGTSFNIPEGYTSAERGQLLDVTEIVKNQNYTWGKLSNDVWRVPISGATPKISESDRWIALEYTSYINKDSEAPSWVRPCSYSRISSPYGWRIHPVSQEYKKHYGVDLAAYTGTPVYATRAGTVRAVGENNSAGKYICITHDSKYMSDYFHLNDYLVSEGDKVSAGQLIGRVGSTGLSTGPHLHFQIWEDGERVDPEKLVDL